MAKPVRKPPGVADHANPRDLEAFFQELYDQHKLVGTRTFDLPNLTAGAQTTFTITVNGAKAGKQQTVDIGLPETWNTGLSAYGFVSADNTVTIVVTNETSGAINLGSATYGVRVRP